MIPKTLDQLIKMIPKTLTQPRKMIGNHLEPDKTRRIVCLRFLTLATKHSTLLIRRNANVYLEL